MIYAVIAIASVRGAGAAAIPVAVPSINSLENVSTIIMSTLFLSWVPEHFVKSGIQYRRSKF